MSVPEELQSRKTNRITDPQEPDTPNHNSPQDQNVWALSKAVFDALPLGIVVFDEDLRVTHVNLKAADLIELTEFIDESLANTKPGINPPAHIPNWTEELKLAVSTGKSCTFDTINYVINGQAKALRITCLPYSLGTAEQALSGTLIIEDITEITDVKKQLAGVQNLTTLGKLTSKVAHELNNPMDGILRYINLTIRAVERENLEKPKEYLLHCRHGLMRMVQIVSDLLEFSRTTYATEEHVKLEQILEDAIRMMEIKAETSNAQISRHYALDIPLIRSSNLYQVFCNLIKNALEAMPTGGELTISTRLEADNTAVVEFRDTGIGIATENSEAIFEPFFTTKDKGKGTGLGLTICKDIIKKYDGRITAEKAPEGGSIFTIYLPIQSNA